MGGKKHEDPKREEMSPSYKQNSAYDVHVATFCSCWIRKYLRTGRPWNIFVGGWRTYSTICQGYILGQEKDSSLKVPGHSVLKTSQLMIQSGGMAAVWME